MEKSSKKRPLFKRNWFQTLLAFFGSQVYINFVESTGWGPKMRDINSGTFLGNIVESELYQKYLTFYETPWYNLFTVLFGIITILTLITGVKKDFQNSNNKKATF
jgi:hypothetical protein